MGLVSSPPASATTFEAPFDAPLGAVGARPGAVAPVATGVRAAPFAALIGLSAFLLFSLELLGGRLVLPVFGGSPGVWTTSLCFFTTVLFAGYLYAHVLTTRVAPDRARFVHLGVGAAAIALTLLAPSDVSALRNPALPKGPQRHPRARADRGRSRVPAGLDDAAPLIVVRGTGRA